MDIIDGVVPLLIAIICLLVINFLVIAKFSFARLREEHVDDMKTLSEDKKNFLKNLYKQPEEFINTTQFLILFFIILLAVLTSNFIGSIIDICQVKLNIMHSWVGLLLDAIILLIISMIILIFGEIIPKALGLSFPEKYISTSATIVVLIGKLIKPFVWFGNRIGNLLLTPFETPYRTELDLVHTEDEIRMMINRSHMEGELDHVESELIDNVFDFVDRMAKEVMIPRQDVDCVFLEDSFEETMNTIRSTVHTRYPLCVEDKDHVIGLIHIKDVMERQEEAKSSLKTIRRDILTIPEVMKLSTLLQYMRTRRIYQAIVVDEYGGMVGLVGLEDIIEELVGDIQDEHESNVPPTVQYDNGSFEFDGKVLVDDVESLMNVEFSNVEEDTIGGYIFGLLERTPCIGDTVEASGYLFKVLGLQGYRITRLKAEPLNESIDIESNKL